MTMTCTVRYSVLNYTVLYYTVLQEEIDMEYRELAESNGIEQWRRVPALNTDERFIDDMADIVVSTVRTCVYVY